MIKHNIPVLQLERHAIRVGEAALKSFHLPLVIQRSVTCIANEDGSSLGCGSFRD